MKLVQLTALAGAVFTIGLAVAGGPQGTRDERDAAAHAKVLERFAALQRPFDQGAGIPVVDVREQCQVAVQVDRSILTPSAQEMFDSCRWLLSQRK